MIAPVFLGDACPIEGIATEPAPLTDDLQLLHQIALPSHFRHAPGPIVLIAHTGFSPTTAKTKPTSTTLSPTAPTISVSTLPTPLRRRFQPLKSKFGLPAAQSFYLPKDTSKTYGPVAAPGTFKITIPVLPATTSPAHARHPDPFPLLIRLH
ncbi:hypothetical protein L226DRAFT_574799 [Lentinus tigrinus ALCF2SS1-7]|uniref:uncharacterized protein n=1 Tax=Lentinus tigrinus ALCF2SS1-7 TaxID=1328758 RepID=UPI0011661B84|nr:hypothetical protein L226DRAFT_574799 [Lentinus tigrinus ALCF2SS1-7]